MPLYVVKRTPNRTRMNENYAITAWISVLAC